MFFCLISLQFPVLGAAQSPRVAPPPTELDAYIMKALADWGLPGLAVAVVRNDSVLFAKGYGVREVGKADRVDEHTVFDAASITKSFTATATGMLVDEGRMRWDEPVRTYVPEIVFPDSYLTANVTIRDLLSHRTGLQAANFMWRFTGYDRAEVLRRVRALRPEMPFRSGMVYSNTGYMIAGEAAARAAKSDWSTMIRQRLLEPLGMKDTFLWSERDTPIASRGNLAVSHIVVDGVQRPIDNRDGAVGKDGRNTIEAAGAVQSSVWDLTTWMRFHLANGMYAGRRLVSEAAMEEMHSPQIALPSPAAFRTARQVEFFLAYGLGFQVWDYRGRVMLWHSGSGNGQFAYMALLPKEKLGVVVLINSWRAPVLHGALASRILDHYLGLATRDYSGDALRSDSSARIRGHDAWHRFMATRDTANPQPKRPASAYAGVFEDSLHGRVTIAPSGKFLTLQMAGGEIADLTTWNGDSLFVTWRHPVYRNDYSTLAVFSDDDAGKPRRLTMRLNRDVVVASRR